MGTFADLRWADGEWGAAAGAHALTITIHDSDIAQVDYAPSPGSVGRFYLGFEPSTYFEDPTASQPVAHAAEAAAFAAWARLATGADAQPRAIRELMATPEAEEPLDVFVEETVDRLLRLIGLQMPPLPD